MLLPIRSKNPPETIPIMTCMLIVINTVVYFATSDHGLTIRKDVLDKWAIRGTTFDFAHMLSSMFLHGGLVHLLGNMWFLYLFGFALEGRLKSFKFTIVYLGSGLTGAALHQLMVGHLYPNQPSIGASGAIMGVVGAAMFIFPHAKVTMAYGIFRSWGTSDWPLYGVALYYLGFDLFWAMLGLKDGVGHFAHLGGALGGFLICMAFWPKRDNETVSEAKATLADTKDLSTLLRSELAQLHQSNPEDTTIILNWVKRSVKEPGGIKDECRQAFLKALPRMLAEHPVGVVATQLTWIAQDPAAVRPAILLDIASRLERAADPVTANQYYDMVQKHPNASSDDLQASSFRIAMIAENAFKDNIRAWDWYSYVVETWPMGPFAVQAKSRMEALSKLAAQAKTI